MHKGKALFFLSYIRRCRYSREYARTEAKKRVSICHILLALGLGLGLIFAPAASSLASAAGNTRFSAKNLWYLSSPSPRSLLNPGNILGLERELTGLFLLNWRGEWFFHAFAREHGGRFVIENTVEFHLNRDEPDLANLVNEVYISLNPIDCFFIDLGKQVPATGTGYFLNPSVLWSRARERRPFLQDRELPPEGKVMLRGEYLFPALTLEVGWAPRLVWAEGEDAFLRKYFGRPQRSSPAWVKVSGGFAGVDGNCLLSYDQQWQAGLNLAGVWGENLEFHAEISWEEWEKTQVDKVNQIFRAITGNNGDANESGLYGAVGAIKATTEKGFFKALLGTNYAFAGGTNLIIEYLFNGNGLTRQEWEQVLLSISRTAATAAGAGNSGLAAAGFQKITAFFAETGFPGLLRHYVMARLYKKLSPALALEQITIQNLVDRSGLAILSLSYEKERSILSFAVQIPYGKRESEFGLMTGEWQLEFSIDWFR